jgi:hypothetical protein
MFAVRMTLNGEELGALADSPKKKAFERAGEQLRDQIASVICWAHGKPAEGADVDFDDSLGNITINLHGVCCDELRTAIESELDG